MVWHGRNVATFIIIIIFWGRKNPIWMKYWISHIYVPRKTCIGSRWTRSILAHIEERAQPTALLLLLSFVGALEGARVHLIYWFYFFIRQIGLKLSRSSRTGSLSLSLTRTQNQFISLRYPNSENISQKILSSIKMRRDSLLIVSPESRLYRPK